METVVARTMQDLENVLEYLPNNQLSVVHYVWTEYGFYPLYFNELFHQFFNEVTRSSTLVGFSLPGQEMFYEPHVDFLVTLEGFIDTSKAYLNGVETKLLVDNFQRYEDRGQAFWYTIRNFNEVEYSELFKRFKFRNVIFPIGEDKPWLFGFPPNPGVKYGEGELGEYFIPNSRYYATGKQAYSLDMWRPNFRRSRDTMPSGPYNTFFLKNSFKTRNYSSKDLNDLLVGPEGLDSNTGFGSISYDFYKSVLDFHIQNNIRLVVIEDLVPFPRVNHASVSYFQFTNHLDVRKLLTLVEGSQNFINSGTSPGDLVAYYLNTNQVVVGDKRIQTRTELMDEFLKFRGGKVFRFEYEKTKYRQLHKFLFKNSS